MGCRRTASFLDLPWNVAINFAKSNFATSTRRLPPQKFDLTLRIRHHLLCQILFLGQSVFEGQIVFSSKQTFCGYLRSVSLLSARNSLEVHSVASSESFSSDSVFFYWLIFYFNFVPVCQEGNNSGLSCFLLFSESSPSI